VNVLADVARRKLKVAAMIMSAGCQSMFIAFMGPQARAQVETLHYASFLLAAGPPPKDLSVRVHYYFSFLHFFCIYLSMFESLTSW
jgi:hypothetical protein